ncbi:hypothetical protein BD289DRAFT_144558 [Coniella lustricola]|uniref:Secreted protein n=1 Tax=Coniella lustricola TaxID=2025994 RepID=A0A2T3AEX8_9PEZI|nr:hypothetical protein BD289DRAFT_144558 [Coniella lustricola]
MGPWTSLCFFFFPSRVGKSLLLSSARTEVPHRSLISSLDDNATTTMYTPKDDGYLWTQSRATKSMLAAAITSITPIGLPSNDHGSCSMPSQLPGVNCHCHLLLPGCAHLSLGGAWAPRSRSSTCHIPPGSYSYVVP